MKFVEDTVAERARIEATIKKFGYAPEHNYFWYQFSVEKTERNVFVMDDSGAGLFAMIGEKDATVFSSPIAPPERRVQILIEFLEEIFKRPNIQKVHLELETPLRREFLKLLPEHCEAKRINYSLVWPIMNMKAFDPSLPGKHYKSLRKERNKFYRQHSVSVEDVKTFNDKMALRQIVMDWKKNRPARYRAYCDEYFNLIENNFEGMVTARVFLVDGKPTGINAGWMIPNSERFYGAVGIHDYSIPSLGKMLYLEDLEYLKSHGYGEVDMGGSWHGELEFKNEFLPESYYKTHVFSVVKK